MARKRETTEYNTAELIQARQNVAEPVHRDTACKKVVNISRVKESVLLAESLEFALKRLSSLALACTGRLPHGAIPHG